MKQWPPASFTSHLTYVLSGFGLSTYIWTITTRHLRNLHVTFLEGAIRYYPTNKGILTTVVCSVLLNFSCNLMKTIHEGLLNKTFLVLGKNELIEKIIFDHNIKTS